MVYKGRMTEARRRKIVEECTTPFLDILNPKSRKRREEHDKSKLVRQRSKAVVVERTVRESGEK